MKKIIIGNNTDAKIFALFNPEYKIIHHDDFRAGTFTEQDQEIMDIIVYLSYNELNRTLLQKLGFGTVPEKKIPIGYKEFPWSRAYQPASQVDKEGLVRSKLGVDKLPELFLANKKIDICKHKTDHMIIFDIPISEVKSALEAHTTYTDITHLGSVLSISSNDIKLYGEYNFGFDEAIFTISAKRMREINPLLYPQELKSTPSTLILYRPEKVQRDEIVYFTRQGLTQRQNYRYGHMVADCLGEIEGDTDDHDHDFKYSVILPHGKIIQNFNNKLPATLEPLGRFAQWNPDIKIEDVVNRATRPNPMNMLWQTQMDVNSKFKSHPLTIKDKQEYTKDYIIHMIYQTTSLLDKINWKISKEEKELDYQEIVTEWVDIFKYWLSIGLAWDIRIEDFLEVNHQRNTRAMKLAQTQKETRHEKKQN